MISKSGMGISFQKAPKRLFCCRQVYITRSKEFYVCNFSGEDFVLPKDYKLGYIELPEPPQYTPVSPVDTAQCHFLKAAERQSQWYLPRGDLNDTLRT
jgi:hypothetical protein